MKPFNLEDAKSGEPVCTRSKHLVTILDFNFQEINPVARKIICKIRTCDGEDLLFRSKECGKHHSYDQESDFDLFMSSVKKEGWTNIYPNDSDIGIIGRARYIYKNKDLALKSADAENCIATVKIEWEE